MKSKPYDHDDRFIISDEIMNMSEEEIWMEIERIKAKDREEYERAMREKQSITEKQNAE